MNVRDPSNDLNQFLEGRDSPRPAYWFHLFVLVSAWYTAIWLAWWLATASPEEKIGYLTAYVHFGALTGVSLVMLQSGPGGIMPKIDIWFWLLIAVSSLILFLLAFFGLGHLFGGNPIQFLRLSEDRYEREFLFKLLLSMLAVGLAFAFVWAMLSVLFVSVRFGETRERVFSKQARTIRLGSGAFYFVLLSPTLYFLRERHPIVVYELANSFAYSCWLVQVILMAGFLWCTCLLMTRFQEQWARLGVGLFVPWLLLWLFWANSNVVRLVIFGHWESAIHFNLGFLLIWSLAMGALYLDGKMPVTQQWPSRRENPKLGLLENPFIPVKGGLMGVQNLETRSEGETEQPFWLDESGNLPRNLASLYVATDELGRLSGWVDDATWSPEHTRTLRLRKILAASRLKWLRALPYGYLMQNRSEAEEFLTTVQELEHLDIDPPPELRPWVLNWISEQPLQTVIVRGAAPGTILDIVLRMPTLRRLAVGYHQLKALEERLGSLQMHPAPVDILVYYRDSDVVRSQAWQHFVDFHESVSRVLDSAEACSGVTVRFCEGFPFAGYFGTPGELVRVTRMTAADIERKIAQWTR